MSAEQVPLPSGFRLLQTGNEAGKSFATLLVIVQDEHHLSEVLSRLGYYPVPLKTGCAFDEEGARHANDAGEAESKHDLVTSEIGYDWTTDCLVLGSGQQLRLPARFVPVFRHLLAPADGTKKVRRSFASSKEIGALFYTGRVLEKTPGVSANDISFRKQEFVNKGNAWKKVAQEFRRDLGRWAVKHGIGRSALVVCGRKDDVYRLGPGWLKSKMVINDSEVSRAVRFDDTREYAPNDGDPSDDQPEEKESDGEVNAW